MEIQLDTKLEIITNETTKASVHLDLCGGSLTISNILLKKQTGGKWQFTLPLIRIGENVRPVVTLQGGMKRAVYQALSEDHATLRASGERRIANSRTFADAFPGEPPAATV